jgi:hypothetical protein
MSGTRCQTVDACDLVWYNARSEPIVGQEGLCRNHHCYTPIAVQEWRILSSASTGETLGRVT